MKIDIHKDFEDLLRILNERSVEYIIVGGYAVSFHSQPKYTKDLDIWINSTERNSEKVLEALIDFGFDNPGITKEDLLKIGNFIQLGYPPVRIDFLTSLEGIIFGKAYINIKNGKYGKVENVPYLSLEDLIENKIKTGRDSDLYDIKWLDKFNKKK
ncbi:MAG: nucleotidyltransferase [Ignavibacteria bacterium]